MKLGRFTRYALIFFDLVLVAYFVGNVLRGYISTDRPIFWVAAILEIGLGWLTYWFWMRSILVSGFKLDRIMALTLVVLGSALPNIFYASGYGMLNPAGSTDLFYYITVITLIIYSSFTINNYLKKRKKQI